MTRCSACQAPLLFATTARGKSMPLDAQPAPNGNVVLRPDDDGVMVAHVLGAAGVVAAIEKGEKLYTSHFVGCPAASTFRKGRAS